MKMLTIEAVAYRLDKSPSYVHDLLTGGEMAYVVLPPGAKAKGPSRHDVRIEPAELDAFIKRHTVPASSP
jgi:hypothetical protein